MNTLESYLTSKALKKKGRLLLDTDSNNSNCCVCRCEYEGCGKSFLLPAKLKSHIKIHKGYPCDVEGCNQQFPLWSALRKHKAEVHPKSNYFQIIAFLFIFALLGKFLDAEFSCPVCNAMFKKPAFLKSHLKVHQHDREVFHCPLDDCPR